MKLLQDNYQTHLSLTGVAMDAPMQRVEDLVEAVVTQEKWAGKRASKLDLDDFLELLAEFNGRGIHFA